MKPQHPGNLPWGSGEMGRQGEGLGVGEMVELNPCPEQGSGVPANVWPSPWGPESILLPLPCTRVTHGNQVIKYLQMGQSLC